MTTDHKLPPDPKPTMYFGHSTSLPMFGLPELQAYARLAITQHAARGSEPVPDHEMPSAEVWAELYRLREAVKGPNGYASWQDAATDERIKRIRAERALAATQPAASSTVGGAKP